MRPGDTGVGHPEPCSHLDHRPGLTGRTRRMRTLWLPSFTLDVRRAFRADGTPGRCGIPIHSRPRAVIATHASTEIGAGIFPHIVVHDPANPRHLGKRLSNHLSQVRGTAPLRSGVPESLFHRWPSAATFSDRTLGGTDLVAAAGVLRQTHQASRAPGRFRVRGPTMPRLSVAGRYRAIAR
jgi:hypothetical protein